MDDGNGDRRGQDERGHEQRAASPLAEEVVRFVGAVQEWARRSFPVRPPAAAEASPEANEQPEPADAATGTAHHEHRYSDCQWCPLCQLVGVLRGERPELTARLAEAGAAFASTVRALLDTIEDGATTRPAGSAETSAPTGTAAPEEASGRVQRIDLDEADDEGDGDADHGKGGDGPAPSGGTRA